MNNFQSNPNQVQRLPVLKIQYLSKNHQTQVQISKDRINPGQLNRDQIIQFQSDQAKSSTSQTQSDVISKSITWIRLRKGSPVVSPSHNLLYSVSKSVNLLSNPWRVNLYGSVLEASSGLNDEDRQALISETFSIELVVYFASKYYLNHVFAPQNQQKNPSTGIILLDHEKHDLPALSIFLFTLQIFVQFMNSKFIDKIHYDDFDVRNNLLTAVANHWNHSIDHFGLFFDEKLIDIIMFYFSLTTKVVHGSEATPDFLAVMKRSITESQTLILKHLQSSIKDRIIPRIF